MSGYHIGEGEGRGLDPVRSRESFPGEEPVEAEVVDLTEDGADPNLLDIDSSPSEQEGNSEAHVDTSVELIQSLGRLTNARVEAVRARMSAWKGLTKIIFGNKEDQIDPIDYPGVSE